MKDYYKEVEHVIIRNETNKRARQIQDNYDTLSNYYEIGKLIVEAQGGSSRAKYGNELIKEWSNDFTKKYGKGYDLSNLKRFRQFYLTFLKGATVWHQLTWSHIKILLPIKDENKRNYYINLCITKNLSVRDLVNAIKNHSYERLVDVPDKIEIINTNIETTYNIREHIKNPIIIPIINKSDKISEKDLKREIVSMLKVFFEELGQGFTFVGLEYKVKIGNLTRYIDLLLFNVELNSYVVIEVKTRELQEKDKGQIEMYMNIIDNTLKRSFHNKSIGIIISKYQDKYIATFVSEDNIIPITYELKSNNN